MVVCHQISKAFGPTKVVEKLDLTIPNNQSLVLLGPSGCGKTTTLRLIAGFEEIDSGRIDIAGKTVADGRRHTPPEKRHVGMVFQDYAIFPHLNVTKNVGFGLGRRGAQQRIDELLEFVGLAGMGKCLPQELSGGQQQRVALARALAPKPDVLLLDEPFSNLDAALRNTMRLEVKRVLAESQTTALFVTHDQEEALQLGDLVGVMNNGRLEQVGTPETVYLHPRTRFVAEFMGDTDFITAQYTTAGVETPMGTLPQTLRVAYDAHIEVAIRPRQVQLVPNVLGNGRITASQFLGMGYRYTIQLNNGQTVRSWQPYTVKLALGTTVSATLDFDHLYPCFHQHIAVNC